MKWQKVFERKRPEVWGFSSIWIEQAYNFEKCGLAQISVAGRRLRAQQYLLRCVQLQVSSAGSETQHCGSVAKWHSLHSHTLCKYQLFQQTPKFAKPPSFLCCCKQDALDFLLLITKSLLSRRCSKVALLLLWIQLTDSSSFSSASRSSI